MKLNQIFSFFLLLLVSTSLFAGGGVVCGNSNESMVKAIDKMNNYLDQYPTWEHSRPVLHESSSSNSEKIYIACVTLVK